MEALASPVAPDSVLRPDAAPEGSFVGRRIDDFALEVELGRGGMGVVYGARQLSLDRKVAVKLLPPAFGAGSELRVRFEREAAAAARLNHPAVVRVFAFGEAESTLFLAMEWIDGQSLAEVLDRLGRTRTRIGPRLEDLHAALGARGEGRNTGFSGYVDAVTAMGAELADALHTAHEAGLIHRDVKPGNILLDRDVRPHLTDFGLARLDDTEGITRSGQILGTPGYMAPEVLLRREVDRGADVFGLGASLYQALSLERPFSDGSTHDVVARVLHHEPPPLDRVDRRIPRDLSNVVLKAIEKSPNRRYLTAAELRDDLRRVLRGEPVRATRIGAVGRVARRVRRRPLLAALTAALVLALSIAGFTIFRTIDQRNAVRRAAREKLAEAETYRNAGKLQSARQALRLALELDPDLEEAATMSREVARRLATLRQEAIRQALVTHVMTRLVLGERADEDASARIGAWAANGGDPRVSRFLSAVCALTAGDLKKAAGHVEGTKREGVAELWLLGMVKRYSGERQAAESYFDRARTTEAQTLEDHLCAVELACSPRLDVVSAEAHIRLARNRWPTLAYLPFRQASIYRTVGRVGPALDGLSTALQLKPDYVEARTVRAAIYRKQDRLVESIAEYDAVLDRRPDYVPAICGRAHSLFWSRKRDEAFGAIEAALERRPNNARLIHCRGCLHKLTGDFEAAIRDFQSSRALGGAFLAELVKSLYLMGRADEANRLVEQGLRLPQVTTAQAAELHRTRGDQSTDREVAERELRRSVALVRNPDTLGMLADRLFGNHQYDEAFRLFDELVAGGLNRDLCLAGRGACRWMRLEPRAAVADLDRGLELLRANRFRRGLAWPYRFRAMAAASLDDPAAAARYQAEALKRSRNRTDRLMLIDWLIRMDDEESVRDQAKKLLHPSDYLELTRAWLLARRGDFERAWIRLQAVQHARGADPRDIPVWLSPSIWIGIRFAGDPERAQDLRDTGQAIFEGRAAPDRLIAHVGALTGARDRAFLRWAAGRIHLACNEPEPAVGLLETAAETVSSLQLDLELGVALAATGDLERALECWHTVKPGSLGVFRLVEALIRQGVGPENRGLVRWLGTGLGR
jgi:tetratricopeptide (TPR) repeat protein